MYGIDDIGNYFRLLLLQKTKATYPPPRLASRKTRRWMELQTVKYLNTHLQVISI